MKKVVIWVTLIVLMTTLVFTFGSCRRQEGADTVLTMGSWRADDVAQMNALLAEYQRATGVQIRFQPTNPPEFNAALRLQLEGGIGPDLMYARSYATGRELFSAGFFGDLSNLPGLRQNFTADAQAPWQMEDGTNFAVPFLAVSHAMYYNRTIFQRHNLSIPQTWEDFLALCQTLLDLGYTPLANGVADEWDILEVFFLNMLPNFIGGSAERARFERGERLMNDPAMVAAFQAMADVARFLPRNFEAVGYNDSQALFGTQQAAMFADGSWSLQAYDGVPFEVGVFAIPAPSGRETMITFHLDAGMAYNRASPHAAEARAFLQWLSSPEGATIAARHLPPGFFPVINYPIQLDHSLSNEFLALNTGRETDVRFIWPQFMELYVPMNHAVIQVLRGQITPLQAANNVEAAAAGIR